MKLRRNCTIFASIALIFAMVLGACSSGADPSASNTASASSDADQSSSTAAKSPAEKIPMVGIADSPDWAWGKQFMKKLEDNFPEYSFVFKTFDASNIDKTLKTMITAGNPPDFSFYWPGYISTYVQGNMALDLTPYLTANNSEWAGTFQEGSLDIGKVDEKYYAIPVQNIYPMIIVNKDVTEKAGVTIPEGSWTWEEFMQINKTIKDKLGSSGIFPFALRYDWACWLARDGLVSNWDTKEKAQDFAAGKISFLEPNIVEVFDNAKAVYDNNYAYPGKGALAVKVDEIWAAFKAGKIAMVSDVNSMASVDIKNTGLTNIQIVSMPHMGPLDLTIGTCDGFFIPANAAHIEDSIKVLKYATSKECLQVVADAGAAVPVKGITGADEEFTKDMTKVGGYEVITLSSQILDVITNKMPADYINKGQSSLENLDAMRKQALEAKSSADK